MDHNTVLSEDKSTSTAATVCKKSELKLRKTYAIDDIKQHKHCVRKRAKKPADAPKRPKSAYMFFLDYFRQECKKYNWKGPDIVKAAGERWRSMDVTEKLKYIELSDNSKMRYREKMAEYMKEHPKEKKIPVRDPRDIRRPCSAYFFFLKDFRDAYKLENPEEEPLMTTIGRLAGQKWKSMTYGEQLPYLQQCQASKAEYSHIKNNSESDNFNVAITSVFKYLPTMTNNQTDDSNIMNNNSM